MNNPIMALAQMAMNRISSDPSFQKNPQAMHAQLRLPFTKLVSRLFRTTTRISALCPIV